MAKCSFCEVEQDAVGVEPYHMQPINGSWICANCGMLRQTLIASMADFKATGSDTKPIDLKAFAESTASVSLGYISAPIKDGDVEAVARVNYEVLSAVITETMLLLAELMPHLGIPKLSGKVEEHFMIGEKG